MSRSIPKSDWTLHANMYAFLGNSLLRPMTPDTACGLSAQFWDSFAQDGVNEQSLGGIEKLRSYAQRSETLSLDDAIRQTSVEYSKLFIGPPKPLAPPWESMATGSASGFGEPTFRMRAALRKAGVKLDGASNQYEDHIGIELLYISLLCSRFAEQDPSIEEESELRNFIIERPLGWISQLHKTVHAAAPGGYYEGIIELAWGLLRSEA